MKLLQVLLLQEESSLKEKFSSCDDDRSFGDKPEFQSGNLYSIYPVINKSAVSRVEKDLELSTATEGVHEKSAVSVSDDFDLNHLSPVDNV